MKHIPNLNWRILPGFPKYAITPDGQVWSFNRNRFLKQHPDNNKYLKVKLYNVLGSITYSVHRLVGMAFVPLPEKFNGNYLAATINHKDHNRQNNHYTNLEWVSLSYNAQEAWDNGYHDHQKRPCFCIDIQKRMRFNFESVNEADKQLGFLDGIFASAINKSRELLYNRYIVGHLDDPIWQERLSSLTIDEIIDLCLNNATDYRPKNRECFFIDIQNKTRMDFKCSSDASKYLGLNSTSVSTAINNASDMVLGRYIVGYLDDPVWQKRLSTLDIDSIINIYTDKIENYKSKKPRACFCIDSYNKTRIDFNSLREVDQLIGLPNDTASSLINRTNGLIQSRYIVGYLDDPIWQERLSSLSIYEIINLYLDRIRKRSPSVITNLQTGESRQYNSLADFARENGFNPDNISRYLQSHPDLYKVESLIDILLNK